MPGDYPTIKAALENARPGDRVELSRGVYQENNLLLPEGIVLIGLGAQPADVVIDGGGSGRLILCESLALTSRIENLTLTRGRAAGPSSYDQSGGAILASNSDLEIMNCVFDANRADSHGGAIRCSNSSLVITDCTFTANSAPSGGGGAVACSFGSSPLFRNCDFDDNTASWGGALSCRAGSSPQVTDCRFRRNIAAGNQGFGGAVFSDYQAAPLFTYSTFHDNSALYGGALASFQSAETNLENCTIIGNTAEFGGAGLFSHDSSPRVTSSIIVFQKGAGITAQGGAAPMISCTNLFGNSAGDWVGNISAQAASAGNMSTDPLFCSTDPGLEFDFFLQGDSPCSDAASSCGVMGAWAAGCDVTTASLAFFEVKWSGNAALLSWQAISSGGAPNFRLTGALASSPDQEWDIPFSSEGGGRFVGEDIYAAADSGQRYVFRLYLVEDDGAISLLGETGLLSVPTFPGIRDLKAWPNPFNPLTSISFHLGKTQQARVSIYTVDGRRITTLADRVLSAGPQEVSWDGADQSGRHVSTGTYIALVEGEHQMQTIKLTLVK